MKKTWFQIVIEDALALPGKNVKKLLKLLVEFEGLNFCYIDDVEGAGSGINWFQINSGQLVSIEAVVNHLDEVIQFDWCDLFLFRNEKEFLDLSRGLKYPDIIKETDLTLRMVDDTYFYIYSTNGSLLSYLKNYYIIESHREGNLEDLDFPD